ncbi:hypothetical protein OF83DRAFT_3789 [Amylostereum chailletii]|nr:hypothetical protein OF83DRAFT_3789 [Amylostereum chailletii]
MTMDGSSARKVTAKVDFNNILNRPPSSRPVSPYKSLNALPDNPRPKAKVNSSATFSGKTRRVSGTSSVVTSSPTVKTLSSISAIPRPTSPSKFPTRELSSTRSAIDAPTSKAKATLTAHALSRQRSLTSTLAHPSPTAPRPRRGSATFSAAGSTTSPSSSSHLSPESAAGSSHVRVRSKVSGLAKASAISAPSSPSGGHPPSSSPPGTHKPASPPYATTRPARLRARSPSIPDFSANPHRYQPHRPVPAPLNTRYQPFCASNGSEAARHAKSASASDSDIQDMLPLPPPQSPPTSTLSFSSHSSRSSSQVTGGTSDVSSSTAPTFHSYLNGAKPPDVDHVPRNAFDAIVDLFDPSSRRSSAASTVQNTLSTLSVPKSEGSQIRQEAKSNRKIEDLEITNRSLLAINSSLEATRHKQAKEIRELRRKLRESRLILPPRAYRAVKSSLKPEEVADDEDQDDEEEEEEEGDVPDAFTAHDETYKRVRGLLDGLLESARKALASTPEDFRDTAVAKVLSAEEVRSWAVGSADDGSDARSIVDHPGDATTDLELDSEDEQARDGAVSPSRIAVPEDDDGLSSEDEVETMMDISPHGRLPPITVTLS